MLHELADAISKVMGHASEVPTAIPGLTLYQNTVPTAPNPCTYVPSLLVIPQGKKRVDLGKQSYVFGESTFLLTSIELPIISRVCAASAEKPYLAFFLKLDMGMVRDVLHSEEVHVPAPPVGTRGMVLGEATAGLLASGHCAIYRDSITCLFSRWLGSSIPTGSTKSFNYLAPSFWSLRRRKQLNFGT